MVGFRGVQLFDPEVGGRVGQKRTILRNLGCAAWAERSQPHNFKHRDPEGEDTSDSEGFRF